MNLNEQCNKAFDAGLKVGVSVIRTGDTLLFGGFVTMRPGQVKVERTTLTGIFVKKVPGWIIEKSIDRSATRDAPADVDVVEAATMELFYDALARCLNIVREQEVFEAINDLKTDDEAAEYNEGGATC